jgi:hypothetical protein
MSGYTEFLFPDPARWPEQLAQARELRRFDDWVQAGGSPRSLPPAVIDELRGVGKRYRNQRLPDPFYPLFEGPTRESGPPPGDFLDGLLNAASLEGYPVPPRLGPWFLSALDAHGRTTEEQERLGAVATRSYNTRRAVDDFPAGFLRLPLEIRSFDLQSLAEAMYVMESSREPMGEWTHEVHRRYRYTMYAMARSIEEEPRTAGLALATFRRAIGDLKGASFGTALLADPARELGVSRDDPYVRAWRGYIRFRASVVQFHLNLDRGPVLRKAIEDFEHVLRAPDLNAHVRSFAIRLMVDSYKDLLDGQQAQDAAERWITLVDDFPFERREEVFDKILEVWEDTHRAPSPEIVERIEAHIASEKALRTRNRWETIQAR